MHLSRSLARVRPLGPLGWERPYVLDYKRGRMEPYLGTGEWGKSRDGRIWKVFENFRMPSIPLQLLPHELQQRGRMAPALGYGFAGSNSWYGGPFIGFAPASFTLNTTALDSAYVYNTSGDAIGSRYPMQSAKTFSEIYFFVSSYTGTAGNVNDIDVEIRNDSSDKPGATLHDTITKDPASATGWVQVTGFTFPGSASTVYWIILADPDGNGTDFATLGRNASNSTDPTAGNRIWAAAVTNGFNTAPTFSGIVPSLVVVFSDGTVIGNPFTAVAASSSTQNRRGLFVSNGFTESLKVYGMTTNAGSASITSVSIYAGSDLPNDATFGSFSALIQQTTAARRGAVGPPVTLAKETPYRFVDVYSGNSTTPSKMNIGTGVNATLRAAMLGAGSWYWAEQGNSAANTWANDDTSAWPNAAVLVDDQVAGGSSSGAGPFSRIFTGM